MDRIRVGETFLSYENDLKPALAAYENETNANLVKAKAELDHANPNLKYKYLKLKCKFHGEHKKIGNTRNTSTYKQSCPHFVSVHQKTRNGIAVLEIYDMNIEHNHVTSEDLFKHLPKQRNIALKQNAEYINSSLDSRGNYRIIQSRLNTEDSDGVITLRDLYNAKAKIDGDKKHDNGLVALVEEMVKISDATVRVITNEQNELDMVFFQDTRIKNSLQCIPI